MPRSCVNLRHLSALEALEPLSLDEILDFPGRKKYSEPILPRYPFNTTREVMNDGPEF